jgi:hypothetical protein
MFYFCTLHRPLSARNTQFPLVVVLRITNPCDEDISVRVSRAHASLVNSTATAAATSAYAGAVTMAHSSSDHDSSVEVSVEVRLQAVEDEYLSSLGDTPPALPLNKLLAALQMNSSTKSGSDSGSDSSSSTDTSTLLEVLHVQGNSAWLSVQLPLQLWYDGFECDSSAMYDAAAAVNLQLAVTDDSSISSSSSSTVYHVEVVLPVSAYT